MTIETRVEMITELKDRIQRKLSEQIKKNKNTIALEPIEIDETFISGQEFIDSLSGFASWQRDLAEEIIDSAVNGSNLPNLIGNE